MTSLSPDKFASLHSRLLAILSADTSVSARSTLHLNRSSSLCSGIRAPLSRPQNVCIVCTKCLYVIVGQHPNLYLLQQPIRILPPTHTLTHLQKTPPQTAPDMIVPSTALTPTMCRTMG